MVLIICKSSFLSWQYSVSNTFATISASEGGGCTARIYASSSVKEAASMFSETRSPWTERGSSISYSDSLKGSFSSTIAAFWPSLDILDFRKQFRTVLVVTPSRAATNICIPSSKEIFGSLFSSQHLMHNIVTVLCSQWGNHTLVPWVSLKNCVQWEEKQLDWFSISRWAEQLLLLKQSFCL